MISLRVAVLAMAVSSPAWAESHAIAIRNGASEMITGIHMAPPGSGKPGDNRLRSQLPNGAEARISYSTGCRADIRIDYASGRTEDHPDVDLCGEGKLTAGSGGVAGPTGAPSPPSGRTGTGTVHTAAAKPGATPTLAQAPPPVVPPWTGRSITKRFGGMD